MCVPCVSCVSLIAFVQQTEGYQKEVAVPVTTEAAEPEAQGLLII